VIFLQESTGCFASNQAKNFGSTVCVLQQSTKQTLSSGLWRDIRLWPFTPPPIPSHDIIPEIVVTPASKTSGTILPKEGEIRRRSFSQRFSCVTQDKDNEPRALDLFSGMGSVTKVLQKEGFHVTSLDKNSKYDAALQFAVVD